MFLMFGNLWRMAIKVKHAYKKRISGNEMDMFEITLMVFKIE